MSLKQDNTQSSSLGVPRVTGVIRGDCPWCGRRDILVESDTRSCMNCGGYVAPVVRSLACDLPLVDRTSYLEESPPQFSYWDTILKRVDEAKPGQTIYVEEEFAIVGAVPQQTALQLKNVLRYCRVKGVTLKYVRPNDGSWLANQLRDWKSYDVLKDTSGFNIDENSIVESMTRDFVKQVEVIMALYGRDEKTAGLMAPESKRHQFKLKTRMMLGGSRPDMTQEQRRMVEAMAMDKYDADVVAERDTATMFMPAIKSMGSFSGLMKDEDDGYDSALAEFHETREAEEWYDQEIAEEAEAKAHLMISDSAFISDLENAVDICRSEAGVDDGVYDYALYTLAFIGLFLYAVLTTFYAMSAGASAIEWVIIAMAGVAALIFGMKRKEAFK